MGPQTGQVEAFWNQEIQIAYRFEMIIFQVPCYFKGCILYTEGWGDRRLKGTKTGQVQCTQIISWDKDTPKLDVTNSPFDLIYHLSFVS